MKRIVTLTLNPAIDGSEETETVRPIRKVRTWGERYDPGGGGINVARVIQELGGSAFVIYLSGGTTGPLLERLVRDAGLEGRHIPIKGHTRISHTVHERSTGLEFRFVPDGPLLEPSEWEACLVALEEAEFDYLVASGSLPRGVPADLYVKVANAAARKGALFILDTSGPALKEAVKAGVYLIKPNLAELEDLVGRELSYPADQEKAVMKLIEDGAAEIVTLTLGRDGALMATRKGLHRLPGLKFPAKSAVGAGDSFLAAMTLGLAEGRSVDDAFALAVAAGTATILRIGTALGQRADVERIYADIKRGSASATA
jgi:6-phosphofructokinase 2